MFKPQPDSEPPGAFHHEPSKLGAVAGGGAPTPVASSGIWYGPSDVSIVTWSPRSPAVARRATTPNVQLAPGRSAAPAVQLLEPIANSPVFVRMAEIVSGALPLLVTVTALSLDGVPTA